MILVLAPNTSPDSVEYQALIERLSQFPGIKHRVHREVGAEVTLTEIYLIGDTRTLVQETMSHLPCVEKVVRISEPYRVLGRHQFGDERTTSFDYNGVHFGQDTFHVFAGLCAVDSRESVEAMMKALQENGQVCTRMGAYKPRTSPYAFQGYGKQCLPYVFELAGKYGIKVIAMEVTHESHVDEIRAALRETGNATGVMLQIGTRNTQNFELLKHIGRQQEFPVLIKRGFGITLDESLNAAEYLASEGNRKVVFCLRGMKTNMGDPHRNFVDFAHVPVLRRLTRMPVCVDPSHSVGTRAASSDGILDIFHVVAQGIIAGANMVLVDFHPFPEKALVDGPQALRLSELKHFLDDTALVRETYLKRTALAAAAQKATATPA
ncbi:MAG: 3-deoxy-7-phosphoheptulonate synthase [Proteobacteria bacterium]|nr:3-deoxy-7-phosphoheptulonate synthase [Pseudomonadota bacterium]